MFEPIIAKEAPRSHRADLRRAGTAPKSRKGFYCEAEK
jgi:hypothetical protein